MIPIVDSGDIAFALSDCDDGDDVVVSEQHIEMKEMETKKIARIRKGCDVRLEANLRKTTIGLACCAFQ